MARRTLSERLHRNEQGQIVLQIALWHDRPGQVALSVYGFFGTKSLERVVLKRQRYPFGTEESLSKAELVRTCQTLALVVALELGEPDPYVTGNQPIPRPGIIDVKRISLRRNK